MAYMRRRRRHWRDAPPPRRYGAIGCLWLVFAVIVIIVLLGLIFGGWTQGTKVNQPGSAPQNLVSGRSTSTSSTYVSTFSL